MSGPEVEGPGGYREVLRRLETRHGRTEKTRRDPLDELLFTILSQNTTDANRDRAWRRLRERFADRAAIRDAAPASVEEAIRPAGLVRQKAAALQGTLQRLQRENGAMVLDHLSDMDDEEALAYLRSFRGVGVKTAACVLCFALRRPVLPVDTHVRRLASRLGWAPEGSGAQAVHEVLNREVPPELRYRLHVALIAHGRATCTARDPACEGCVLADACPRVGVESV